MHLFRPGAQSLTSTKDPGPNEANLLAGAVKAGLRFLPQAPICKFVEQRRATLTAVARTGDDWSSALWAVEGL